MKKRSGIFIFMDFWFGLNACLKASFSNGIFDFGSLDTPCFGTLILDRVSDSILFLVVPLLPIIIPKKALAIWKDAWNQSWEALMIFGGLKHQKVIITVSARSSVYEHKVLLTKPFQACQSWHQLSVYENKVQRSSSPNLSKLVRADISCQFMKRKFLCKHLLRNKWTLVGEKLPTTNFMGSQ